MNLQSFRYDPIIQVLVCRSSPLRSGSVMARMDGEISSAATSRLYPPSSRLSNLLVPPFTCSQSLDFFFSSPAVYPNVRNVRYDRDGKGTEKCVDAAANLGGE